MATRSFICHQNKIGKYTYVYCHSDGYLEWNGRILHDSYNTRQKVIDLLNHGDISSLNIHIGSKHDSHVPTYEKTSPHYQECTFYARDFGHICTIKVTDSLRNIVDEADEVCVEFIYIFTLRDKWIYAPIGEVAGIQDNATIRAKFRDLGTDILPILEKLEREDELAYHRNKGSTRKLIKRKTVYSVGEYEK